MKKTFLIVLIALVSFGFNAMAQHVPAVETDNDPGWHKIASMVVDFKADRDEVAVLGKDHFKAIRLKVTDRALEMGKVIVVYENDQRQEADVRNLIKAGEQTRIIDLDGQNRAIKKIILHYTSIPNAKDDRANVEIWGLK